MPWQKVVGVNRETGGLILENSEGERWEASVFPQVAELRVNHKLSVKVETYPEWQPPRFQAWYTDSPDSETDV